MALTYGNWSVGKHGCSVISDTIPESYDPGSGHDEVNYYGGFLLAESVGNDNDAELFAQSKNILVLVAQVLKEVNRPDLKSVIDLNHIIEKFL